MKRTLTLIMTLLIFNTFGQSFSKRTIRRTWKSIPVNIQECLNKLDTLFTDSSKVNFSRKEEKVAVSQLNFYVGMSIRDNWKLWHGSVLSKYFNNLSVYSPEDMSYIILTSYHRKLNYKPIDFDRQLKEYHALVQRHQSRPPKPIDNFHFGDTVSTVRFGPVKLLKKQAGYKIQALVLEIDTITNKIKLRVLSINKTETGEKEELKSYVFQSETLSKDYIFWTDAAWWRKNRQLLHIDITY